MHHIIKGAFHNADSSRDYLNVYFQKKDENNNELLVNIHININIKSTSVNDLLSGLYLIFR